MSEELNPSISAGAAKVIERIEAAEEAKRKPVPGFAQ